MIPRCQMKIIHSAVDNDIFKKIFDDEKLNYPVFICKTYCWGGLNNNEIPKFSKLNNMFLNQSPPELILNSFELNLIQLGKCFHTITKLKPFKKMQFSGGIPALKGNNMNLYLISI